MVSLHPSTHNGSSKPQSHRSQASKKNYGKRRGRKAHLNIPITPSTLPLTAPPATSPQSSLKDQNQDHAKAHTHSVISQPVTSQCTDPLSKKNEHSTIELVKQEPLTFLAFPGEIRNSIYRLVIQHQRFKIERLKSGRGLTHLWWNGKTWKPANVSTETRRCSFDLPRRLSSTPSPNCNWTRGSAALLFTCRQVSQEVGPLFYNINSFDFTSFTVLERFMLSLNPAAKSAIRSISVRHGTYGDPCETEFVRWKVMHDERWASVCWQAAEELKNLEELKVLLQINDIPLQLNLEASWAAPLLAFRGRSLNKVRVTLLLHEGYGIGDQRLQNCAKVVRRELLGANYTEVVKEKKSKQDKGVSKNNLVPKAIKCLVVRDI